MAVEVNIGELDTMVTLRRCVITSGAEGAKAYSFEDYSKVFAKVERRVEEDVQESNLEEGQTVDLTIYKVPALTTRWRVSIDGREYEITGIDPISRASRFCVLTLHVMNNGR